MALVCTLNSFAQQQPLYTMYMCNQLIINPAYAGSREALTASAVWREQWVGLDGAPSTQVLSVHSPLPNEKIGLGLTVQNDNIGPSNNTDVWGDFAYRLQVTENSKLSFGLRAGFGIHQANLRDINNVDDNDPAFNGNVENNFLPNFGFGAYYYGNRGYVGVASPTILENELNSGNNAGSDFEDRNKRHFYLLGGYVFALSQDSAGVMFKPSTVVRVVEGAPVSFDVSANFLIKQKLWVGAAYRFEDSFSAILSFQFTDHLQAGYSYDFGTSDLRDYHSGSHEIMLTYDFFKEQVKTKSPRYF
jgi:type IX secretion system PorP/SprF family membrane protein